MKSSLFVRRQHTVCDFSNSDSWVILSPIEQSIKRKIEAVGTPLKDWDINIYRGVLTGCNEAFIISTEKRNEILANCKDADERKRTEELIRPILRGRDIKRYGYEWANLFLIATFPARHYNIDEYPSVKEYLLSFAEESLRNSGNEWVADNHLADFCQQKLSQTGRFIEIEGKRIIIGNTPEKSRKKTCNKWFETQDSIGYWEDFNKPKIIFQEIVQESQFCYDNKNMMCNDTGRIIVGKNLPYLLGVMNSKLFFFAVKTFYGGGVLGEQGIRMKHTFFEHFHCVTGNDKITSVVDALVKAPGNTLMDTFEKELYKQYGLTQDEIKFIESQQNQ